MPFTFSHPAIILPFARIRAQYISMSCLVAGSITPDFQYFLQMKLKGRISHTWHGAFLVDLPIAIFIVVVFHLIVKKPLINNLPGYFQSRLVNLRDFNFLHTFRKNWIGYLLCLQVGILSHILWDSFTHANTIMVEHMEFLSWRVEHDIFPDKPLFRYFQHISTLIGAIFIAWYFHTMPRKSDNLQSLSYKYWLVMLGVMSLSFLIRWSFGFRFFGDSVVSLISSLFIGLIVAGLVFHSPRKRFTT